MPTNAEDVKKNRSAAGAGPDGRRGIANQHLKLGIRAIQSRFKRGQAAGSTDTAKQTDHRMA
jgi:hypothetical protein